MKIVEIEGFPFVFGEIFDYHYKIDGGKDEEKLTFVANRLEDACNYLVKKMVEQKNLMMLYANCYHIYVIIILLI